MGRWVLRESVPCEDRLFVNDVGTSKPYLCSLGHLGFGLGSNPFLLLLSEYFLFSYLSPLTPLLPIVCQRAGGLLMPESPHLVLMFLLPLCEFGIPKALHVGYVAIGRGREAFSPREGR